MIGKRFKQIMVTINLLFAIPVIWVITRELLQPEPVNLTRIFGVAALVAIPLAGTVAITIAGSGVLKDD